MKNNKEKLKKYKHNYYIKKALACADLHIDINNRPEDTMAVMRQIMTYAVKNSIDVVYVIGDIYERKRPYNSEKALFEKFVKYLSDKGIEIIILSGNHDMDKDQVSAVEEFKILELPNITLKPNPSVVPLGKFNVFLGHFLVQGAKLGPTDYQIGSPISIKSILSKWKADIYLLGDVHKAQKLNDNPPMLYVGSPERTDFGERNEKKGFTLLTANANGIEYKFIELNTRPMIQFDLEFCDLNDWILDEGNYVKGPDTTNAIVKIKITCDKEEYAHVDESEIREKLNTTKQIIFEYDITKKTRIRSKRIKETSSPVKAFEHYAKLNELDQKTIELGLKIMESTK